jgi:L-ascorbate metabolism protein UlaG (beta-lactamase superfamily)
VLTDPYESGSYDGAVKYDPVRVQADVVLISHDTHPDHADADSLPGSPVVVKAVGPTEAGGLKVNGIATYHDASHGRDRGPNTVFTFEMDGVKVCHLGDLGHLLTAGQLAAIGKPDVVFIPVGGYFTIDAAEATKVVNQLGPTVVIPMHFKTPKLDFPVAGPEEFLKGKANVEKPGTSEVEISSADLGAERRIVLLDPSL